MSENNVVTDPTSSQSDNQNWPDLSGRLDGGTHVLPIRVYYEDTDFSGLVYHVTYLRWCERGRTDFVRLIGLNQKALFEGDGGSEAAFFVVRHMELDYLKPARMDDILTVVTSVVETTAATVKLHQIVRRDEVVLFKLDVVIVLVNSAGRPARLSEAMKAAFLPES